MEIIITDARIEVVGTLVDLEHAEAVKKYPNPALGISVADVAAIGFGQQRTAKYVERFFGEPHRHMWQATDGKEIIGFAAATKDHDEHWLRKLYVRSDYQGRTVGTQLLETVEAWLGNDKNILVGVASYDISGKAFFEKHGYTEFGTRPTVETTVPTGKVIPETILIKRFGVT